MAYRIIFLGGLLFILAGQILLAQGNEFVYSQQPIDFAHWLILSGSVLLIPQTVTFPPKIYSYIGIPLSLAGIACVIGMCVLDIIWWSFPSEEARMIFTDHISKVPSIWKPFITIGPSSRVFNLGLFILSLNYVDQKKSGVAVVFLATLVLLHLIPVPYRLINGYLLTLTGFSIIFLSKSSKAEMA